MVKDSGNNSQGSSSFHPTQSTLAQPRHGGFEAWFLSAGGKFGSRSLQSDGQSGAYIPGVILSAASHYWRISLGNLNYYGDL